MTIRFYPCKINDGFLDLEIDSDKDQIVEHLSRYVVTVARVVCERRTNENAMERVFRCSRMCWELIVSGRMTGLDRADVDILLSLPLSASSGTEVLFDTLNLTRSRVSGSEMDPKTIHGASIGLLRSMTS